jgi:hypothetical protein
MTQEGKMPNPLQIKPASTARKSEDRKLFVGMLSKSLEEAEVRILALCYIYPVNAKRNSALCHGLWWLLV